MAWTKMTFYFTALLLIGVVTVMFMDFGNNMINHDKAILNDRSKEYMEDYSGYVSQADFDTLNDSTSEERQKSLTGAGNESESFSVTDVLAAINFYTERIGQIIPTIRLIWNAPSFFVQTLIPGGQIGAFRIPLNIFGIVIYIALIVLVVRAVRGS